MDVIILIFFVLLIATLLLGIWQIKNPKLKTADDLSDDLCLYCPLDDDEKGTHDAKTIRKAALETGYYGEIYNWLYYQSKK